MLEEMDEGRRPRRWLRFLLGALGAVLGTAAGVAGWFATRNRHGFQWAWRKVEQAGFKEKQVTVGGCVLNYGEGPDSGRPPLLLIHGQGSDWKSYAPALVALSKTFHVHAVDVHGHGGSARLEDGYSAVRVAADLARFVEEVIGEPVVLSGHSSGGQLAALLAATSPGLVRSVLLEDPPMFTTLLPRARDTWNWRDLATNCHEFLETGGTDFVAHHWEHQLMWKFFGEGARGPRDAGLAHRRKHPDEPLNLWWWPMNELYRPLQTYDPHFGDAFYTGAWDEGFDHEATLRAIQVPATFVHTRISHDGDLLQGATDDDEAARIAGLLADGEFVKVETGHNFHGEDPEQFVRLLEDLLERS